MEVITVTFVLTIASVIVSAFPDFLIKVQMMKFITPEIRGLSQVLAVAYSAWLRRDVVQNPLSILILKCSSYFSNLRVTGKLLKRRAPRDMNPPLVIDRVWLGTSTIP